MPITITFSTAGNFLLEDNGTPGDDTSVVTRMSDGVILAVIPHPADSMIFRAVVPGVNLFVDFLDSFAPANVTIGVAGDDAQSPDNINVNSIQAGVQITLAARNAINELGADASADIIAGTIVMSAGTGIGVTGALEIQAPILEATTDTGGIDLRSLSAVGIGGAGLQVATLGSVKLEAHGSIFLSSEGSFDMVKSGSSNGNITLTALGGGADILCTADQSALIAQAGKIVLEAGQDILLGTGGIEFGNDVRAHEDIKLTAGRDVVIDGFADIFADGILGTSGGGVTVTAGRDIRVSDATGNSGSIAVLGSGGGDIRLITGFGGALHLEPPSTNTISAGSGDVIVDADRIVIGGTSGITTPGFVHLRPRTEGRAILLGSLSDGGAAVELSDGELDRIFASSLIIGSDTAGVLRVGAPMTPANVAALTLVSGSRVQVDFSLDADAITLRSGRDVTIVESAVLTSLGPALVFVDDDGADGGQGGRVLVGAAFGSSLNITGAADGDLLQGGAVADTLDGGAGVDTLQGRDGDDTYVTTAGDVVTELVGEGVDTVQTAGNGALGDNLENLTLTGAANSTGTGNGLDNRINGNVGDNLLSGAGGKDTLNGFAGADTLNGGNSKDRLNGGGGQDVLNGGAKSDRLEGGADADRFRFDTTPHSTQNSDQVVDFVVADDTVELENSVFTALGAGVLPGSQFVIGPAAADGNDFIIYDSVAGALFYDADGNGGGAAIRFATIDPGLAMTRFDFVVT
jgi:Ca2+-binding RTX toxin-like protein